jgi:hypothetical protein
MASINEKQTSFDHTQEFRVIADKISEIAATHSLRVVGYYAPELPLYSKLSAQKQSDVISQLQVFLQTMQSAATAGDRLDNSERSLWHALSTLGLIPPSDMFSHVCADDVVEIYDLEGIQIWRNFNFMKICSYTLEEMYSIDWPSRYKRDPERTAECMGELEKVLSGRVPEFHFADIPEHLLEETSSTERYVLSAKHDWIGKLKPQTGGTPAWIVLSKVKIVGRGLKTAPSQRRLELVPTAPSPSLH